MSLNRKNMIGAGDIAEHKAQLGLLVIVAIMLVFVFMHYTVGDLGAASSVIFIVLTFAAGVTSVFAFKETQSLISSV